MLLGLKKSIIYGPVHSRRLGTSLGINVLPLERKTCQFDCLYCQYGWTGAHIAETRDSGLSFPAADEVGDSLAQALPGLVDDPLRPGYLTFSGHGEPTLHPEFDRIVDRVIAVRDERMPEAMTAILSNSALVTRIPVRKALLRLDHRIMKLDCGSPEVFKRFNRPCRGVHLDDITEGLAGLARRAPLTIQTLFCSGKGGNDHPRNIREWRERLRYIHPAFVQIYSLDRPFPAPDLVPVLQDMLALLKIQCEEEGIPAGIF
jgi:wyosine [tRNA(Phe)-imidazoG37] synthetase (radical SAM superfamily)